MRQLGFSGGRDQRKKSEDLAPHEPGKVFPPLNSIRSTFDGQIELLALRRR